MSAPPRSSPKLTTPAPWASSSAGGGAGGPRRGGGGGGGGEGGGRPRPAREGAGEVRLRGFDSGGRHDRLAQRFRGRRRRTLRGGAAAPGEGSFSLSPQPEPSQRCHPERSEGSQTLPVVSIEILRPSASE